MSTSGISVDVVNLDIDDASKRGRLTVAVPDRPAFMALIAHLDDGGVLGGLPGGARFLILSDEVATPSTFPAQVTLNVVEAEPPEDAPLFRMSFGNNFLQDSCWVNVVTFTPPAEDGSTQGTLRAHCGSLEEYQQLRRFTDEPHGSALRSMEGLLWYVQRVADDGDQGQPFPQVVTFQLRWHMIH